jgi:hypothetical protein
MGWTLFFSTASLEHRTTITAAEAKGVFQNKLLIE